MSTEPKGQITAHRIERKPLSDLRPAPYNPRRISKAARAGLESSLRRFGYVEPIVWNEHTGNVVGGHQRLDVLRESGVSEADVVIVDLPERDEKALSVALNNPHISGEFDHKLGAQLDEIRDQDEMLFRELRLDELLAQADRLRPGKTDPDAVPDLPKKAATRLGDLYEMGEHRLLCGDSTTSASVEALLGTERVDALVSDPPYGVDYGAKNESLNAYDRSKGKPAGQRITKRIASDARVEGGYRAWFASWLRLVPWASYATFHIFMFGIELHNLRGAVDDCGYKWGDYLIWLKNGAVLGRKDYNSKHEFVLYGWPERHRFYGPANSETVLEYDRPRKSELHPTMKPVELVERLVENGSAPGAIVYEPFAGSGSTVIACERVARRCRAIEIDPVYCDVIVRRWEEFTGKKATLHRGAA